MLASSWAQSAIDCETLGLEWALAIIGGSVSKGAADYFSDVDICLVCPSGIAEKLCNSLKGTGKIIHEGRDTYGPRLALAMPECYVLDIHIADDQTCRRAIEKFESGEDVSNVAQDLLWCLCNGQRCSARNLTPTYAVVFSDDLKTRLVGKYAGALGIHKLDVYTRRGDTMQQWEALLSIAKVLINIGNARNGELFWGYKHLQTQLHRFPDSIRMALILLLSIIPANVDAQLEALKEKIELVKSDCSRWTLTAHE